MRYKTEGLINCYDTQSTPFYTERVHGATVHFLFICVWNYGSSIRGDYGPLPSISTYYLSIAFGSQELDLGQYLGCTLLRNSAGSNQITVCSGPIDRNGHFPMDQKKEK